MVSHWFVDNDEAVHDGASSGDPPRDRCDLPPFPFVRYVEQYGDRFEGRRMNPAGDVWKIRNVFPRCPRDTIFADCIKR